MVLPLNGSDLWQFPTNVLNIVFDPEYADSSEVKFEELKNVKLDEEEEEPEAAVLDLSIPHPVPSALGQAAIKQSSISTLQASSPSCSSDSESSDLPRQAVEQAEVFTVHSYAKEEANGRNNDQHSGKKAIATASMNEQELAKVMRGLFGVGGQNDLYAKCLPLICVCVCVYK